MERRDLSRSPEATPAVADSSHAEAEGWYLYGITRGGALSEGDLPDSGEGRVQVLEFGDLAACVRTVPLSEFAPERLAERAGDAEWLERMVREHNEVIAAVHERHAILPAKFGAVYAGTSDLGAALGRMEAALLAQLALLEDADEWAVHLYAEREPAVRRVAAAEPGIRELEQEIANARPGRAYFLQRKLADELAAATDTALGETAQSAYEQLASQARASQISPLSPPRRSATGAPEILRAAFLVARADAETFLQTAGSLGTSQDGIDLEYTGPWPPYSFAGPAQEESA